MKNVNLAASLLLWIGLLLISHGVYQWSHIAGELFSGIVLVLAACSMLGAKQKEATTALTDVKTNMDYKRYRPVTGGSLLYVDTPTPCECGTTAVDVWDKRCLNCKAWRSIALSEMQAKHETDILRNCKPKAKAN